MIYLIITTCVRSKVGIQDFEHRKARYLECIGTALNLVKDDPNIKVIVVENNGERETYLDDICHVDYTDNNAVDHWHKGVNELLDVQEMIRRYDIQSDDMVVKMTGRYKMLSLSFLNTVKNNEHEAFIKFFNVCTLEYMPDDCVLGLVAIKAKYLKGFSYSALQSPECDFAQLARSTTNVKEIQNLDIECCFADDLRFLTV